MGGVRRRRHKGIASGRGEGESWLEPSIFRAVILGNFLFIQRLGMRFSICWFNIYYMHIGLVPRTL